MSLKLLYIFNIVSCCTNTSQLHEDGISLTAGISTRKSRRLHFSALAILSPANTHGQEAAA